MSSIRAGKALKKKDPKQEKKEAAEAAEQAALAIAAGDDSGSSLADALANALLQVHQL